MAADLHAVVAYLANAGIPATIEYPGFLAVPSGTEGLTWHFGTANASWGGDLFVDGDGGIVKHVDLGIASTSDDAATITALIIATFVTEGGIARA